LINAGIIRAATHGWEIACQEWSSILCILKRN